MTTEFPRPEGAPGTTVDTVRGPVPADSLGVTLSHEHMFVLSQEFQTNYPALWDAAGGVRSAVAQLQRAYDAGVRTLVDMTVIGQGRDLDLVLRVAAQTPLNVVLATGVYSLDGVPLFARFRGPGTDLESEDPLVELLTGDITDGIGDTGVRAGLVKFACENAELAAHDHRMAAVVAEVHRRTGVPVVVHSNPFEGNGVDLVRLLAREGVDPERVVIAHAGDSPDLGYLRALADTGCMLGYDRYGMVPFAPDEQRNETLAALARAGHLAQLLVSQDYAVHIDYVTLAQRQEMWPDWSYTHLFERVLPKLVQEPGMDEAAVATLLVDNPRRLLLRTPVRAAAQEVRHAV
ncbi:phosphotriesterase family protein [Actinacidiphila sp. bgisy144]|uniref:phosphotriesterase family protein n=1 Tax=unclassified Actinacidiphila TaxID=2995708 RepID=UPI003EBA983B